MAAAEERGYYVLDVDAVNADSASLAAMSVEEWRRAFGPWVGAVLSTRLVVADTTSPAHGQEKKREVTVEARLFSADSSRVLWSRAADGRHAKWSADSPWTLHKSGDFVIKTRLSNSVRVAAALTRAVQQAILAAPPAR